MVGTPFTVDTVIPNGGATHVVAELPEEACGAHVPMQAVQAVSIAFETVAAYPAVHSAKKGF